MNADKNLLGAMIAELQKYKTVQKAVLFGSRARGDNTDRSDYDIAVYGDLSNSDKTYLRLTFDEDLPTLHKIDLVIFDELSEGKFKQNIEREGVVFYDAKN